MPVHHVIDGVPGVAGAGVPLPLGLIGEVVVAAGARERRVRLLPAAAVMVFVLGLCLFSGDSYGEVARKLAPWLGRLCGRRRWGVPGSSALSRARRRVGPRPFELLFERLAGPLAGAGTPGAAAFGRELVLMSVDGTTLEVPFTPATVAAYGPPPRGPAGGGGFPQLRLLTLIGCGTRGLADAVFGPRKASEQELTRTLAGRGRLGPGMLVLADRNFCGHPTVSVLASTNADLLIRATATMVFPVLEALPDGSARTILADPAAARRRHVRNCHRRRRGSTLPPDTHTLEGIEVRLIEADITSTTPGRPPVTTHYRLITTLLDHTVAPAADLAMLYAQRWESETGYREIKTFLHGPGRQLRARGTAGVEQETWALLCAAQLLHTTRAQAAASAGHDPDRISFTVTLRALRRQITHPAPSQAQARRALHAEILSQLLPPARRQRTTPRALRTSTAKRRQARTKAGTGTTTYKITLTPPTRPRPP